MADIEQQLLSAIAASGKSLNQLAKESGVHYASLHGFVNDGRKISIATVNKLANALGLELREEK